MKKVLPKKFYHQTVQPEVVAIPAKRFQFPKISLSIPDGFGKFSTSGLGKFTLSVSNRLPIGGLGSQTLAAALTHRVFLFNFAIGFLLMAIAIVGIDLRSNVATLETVQQEKKAIQSQVNYWQEVVGKYSGYRDGFYQLAVLEYRLGNKEKASEYARKALTIDPGYVAALRYVR